MSFIYDGPEPEYDAEHLKQLSTTALLDLRDLCLLMIKNRHNGQQYESSGYEYNSLTLEIWYLKKILSLLDKELIAKFSIDNIPGQFNGLTLIKELGLNDLVSSYFDMGGISNKCFEIVPAAKVVFKNFSRCIADDWKFL